MVGRLLRFVHVVIIICFDDGSPLYFFFSQIEVENAILRLLFLYILQSYFPYTLYYNGHCQQHNCKDYIPYRKIPKILPFCTSCFILFTFLYIKFIRDQTCQGSDQGSQTSNIHSPEKHRIVCSKTGK